MSLNPVEVSSLTALLGPGVRFSGVKAERSGATIDVTFDVAWTDCWGPGQRGPGFSPRNWDAAWVFFKYRLADPKGNQVVIEIPLADAAAAGALAFLLDEGTEDVLAAILALRPRQSTETEDASPDDNPWRDAQYVVRTVQPGSTWYVEVRDSPQAPSYRIEIRLRTETRAEREHPVLELKMLRHWKHARILRVQDPGTAVVDPSGDGTGVFIRQKPPGTRGPVQFQGVRLRCALMDLPMDLEPTQAVELWPFGIEMVYVPEEPFWLGDPDPRARNRPQNCFYDSLAPASNANRAYHVTSENPIQVGPLHGKRRPFGVTQLLWYDNNDDARGAGDHQRIHGLDTLAPHERWKEAKIPREFPKGFQAFYVMKRLVTQGQYAEFINALDGGTHPDRFGQLVRYSWDGAGTHRGTIEVPGPDPYTRVATRPHRACNHLCWADAVAFAAWAGLRPMTELEYEKACRGPRDPVPGEFAWGVGPVRGANVIAKEILGHEDGTEIVVGNCNLNNRAEGFKGGDGGVGPVRDDALDLRRPAPEPSTFWLNQETRAPDTRADTRGERESRGLSYYGVAGLSGNLWELCVTVGTREGRTYRGGHGRGEVTEHGEAPFKQLGWPNHTGRSVSWRGGSFFTNWTRGQVAARPYGSGAPGFFHRSNDAGFRAVRTAPPPSVEATPSKRAAEHGPRDQETLIRSRSPDKLMVWLPPARARAAVRTDAAVCAALFDMSESEYNAIKESIDVQVGKAARDLLQERGFRKRVEGLAFPFHARLVALGDDCLDDRQSWVEILRYVLEECHDKTRIAVINAGVRDDTTTQMIPRVATFLVGAPPDKAPHLVLCLAGVSDARRFRGMARTQVTPAETEANLGAIRDGIAAGRTEGQPPGSAGPAWIWLTPPRVDDEGPSPGSTAPPWRLENKDLLAVAEAVRAVARRRPDDRIVDLHALGVTIDQHAHVPATFDGDPQGAPAPPSYVGLLSVAEHKRIVREIVEVLAASPLLKGG